MSKSRLPEIHVQANGYCLANCFVAANPDVFATVGDLLANLQLPKLSASNAWMHVLLHCQIYFWNLNKAITEEHLFLTDEFIPYMAAICKCRVKLLVASNG